MFLTNGHRTLVSMSLLPGVFLREREVQPPSLDMGGSIDTTTMRNSLFRTATSKTLITVGELTMMCQYDPFVYNQFIVTLGGVRQLFTVQFPDGMTFTFWGALEKITPPSHKEGDFPLMEVKIIPHLRNTTATAHLGGLVADAANEVSPVRVAGANVGNVL